LRLKSYGPRTIVTGGGLKSQDDPSKKHPRPQTRISRTRERATSGEEDPTGIVDADVELVQASRASGKRTPESGVSITQTWMLGIIPVKEM